MNYRKVFYDKSDEDLVKTLDEHDQMNLDAKHALKEIIKDRNISVDSSLLSELEDDLNHELQKVDSLDYIKHLGLDIQRKDDLFIVKRSLEFNVANWVGFLVGLLLSFVLIPAFSSWAVLFENGIDSLGVVNGVVLTAIGGFGVALLLKTLSRMLTNMGFKIIKQEDRLFIHNLTDTGVKIIETNGGALGLKEHEGEIYISVKVQDQEYKLLSTSGGQVHKSTMKKLYQILK